MPQKHNPARLAWATRESLTDEDLDKIFIEYENEPEGVWDLDDLHDVLRWGVKNNMSDMILSSGEPIWLSRLGYKIPITTRKLRTTEIDSLIDLTAKGKSVSAALKGGVEKNYPYEFKYDRKNSYRYRVNATSTLLRRATGSAITLRFIPDIPPTLREMGVEPDLCESLIPPDGFILVAGKTGTGKTTLIGSIIREILESPGKSIVTYEDPVEFIYKDLPNRESLIDHHQIGANLKNWDNASPNANRRDPDIVFLGEAKERATMAGLLELGNIGKACYATLHTSRVRSIIPRILDKFDHIEKAQMANTLSMNLRVMISQRLLFSKNGGRVAIREWLVLTSKHRDQLLETAIDDMPALIDEFVNKDGQSFLKSAEIVFKAGKISEKIFKDIQKEMA